MKNFNCFLVLIVLVIFVNNSIFAQVKTKIFPEQIPSKFLKIKNEANTLKVDPPEGFRQKKKDFELNEEGINEKEN